MMCIDVFMQRSGTNGDVPCHDAETLSSSSSSSTHQKLSQRNEMTSKTPIADAMIESHEVVVPEQTSSDHGPLHDHHHSCNVPRVEVTYDADMPDNLI